ncbi:hypothetical protein VN97_g3173 [Penicillium thymicola]|uniref:Uncharacterized protein n=1 Tax=Penicillium thymicola TaxID=293382 RepID=A0AAI9TNH6_PENTH|nr:hypothetical protein VN97_g3173 [Penicillium thymicola]
MEWTMDFPRSWLPNGLNEGDEVSLDKPTSSRWVIGKPVNTHSYQSDERRFDSYFHMSAMSTRTKLPSPETEQISPPRSWMRTNTSPLDARKIRLYC